MAGVTVYTKRWCPFCIAARRLLSSLGVDYDHVPLDSRPELRRELSAANGGWPTVPMIFVGETFVGGFDDLRRLHGEGRLGRLLEGAGLTARTDA